MPRHLLLGLAVVLFAVGVVGIAWASSTTLSLPAPSPPPDVAATALPTQTPWIVTPTATPTYEPSDWWKTRTAQSRAIETTVALTPTKTATAILNAQTWWSAEAVAVFGATP